MPASTKILGLSAYYHDSAAALLVDGEICAAAQEERFTRHKGDSSFPHHAVNFCLEQSGINERDLDYIVYYENPYAKFERLLTTCHLLAPGSLSSYLCALPSWLSSKLWTGRKIADELGVDKPVFFCDHHLSHAASAFFPSPFSEAAILTIDGVGEWSTTTFGQGVSNTIELSRQIRFPNSLGLLYSAFTSYAGFKVNSGEHKLMGLSPYGEPKYADVIEREIVKIKDSGAIALNQNYFDYAGGMTMTSRKFHELFGGPPRQAETPVTQKEMDIAASIQTVLNKAILKMAHYVHGQTGQSCLTLAGGVALNVVANGQLLQDGPFERIWIQPAAGDAGGAPGAALWMWHQVLGNQRKVCSTDSMMGAFLGVEISPAEPADDAILRQLGAVWHDFAGEDELAERIASELCRGRVVAVARGRAEFGPRALGARSILADPRDADMQRRLNMQIKFRESFRPFAPVVLEEEAGEYFQGAKDSPYMLVVFPLAEKHRKQTDESRLSGLDRLKQVRSDIPAVTHVDYSARAQTVDAHRNPFMFSVISKFKEKTGCPVLVNTSFNVRGEPIVNNVEDAYRCFMATEIDCLVVGNRFIDRLEQTNRPLSQEDRSNWLKRFAPD